MKAEKILLYKMENFCKQWKMKSIIFAVKNENEKYYNPVMATITR
jgi:hypothetical protein